MCIVRSFYLDLNQVNYKDTAVDFSALLTNLSKPQNHRNKMKNTTVRFLSVMLMALLLVTGLPSHVNAQQQSTEQQFVDELTTYSQTHTREETQAYAQTRADNMTNESLDLTVLASKSGGKSKPRSYFGQVRFVPASFKKSFFLDDASCRRQRGEICRQNYNAEILTSAGVATGIFGGCNAITALTGFIACTGAALAVHGFGIAAAHSHRNACVLSGNLECDRDNSVMEQRDN